MTVPPSLSHTHTPLSFSVCLSLPICCSGRDREKEVCARMLAHERARVCKCVYSCYCVCVLLFVCVTRVCVRGTLCVYYSLCVCARAYNTLKTNP